MSYLRIRHLTKNNKTHNTPTMEIKWRNGVWQIINPVNGWVFFTSGEKARADAWLAQNKG